MSALSTLTPIGLYSLAVRLHSGLGPLWHGTARPGSYHADLHAQVRRAEDDLTTIRLALEARPEVWQAIARAHEERQAALSGATIRRRRKVAAGRSDQQAEPAQQFE